MNGRLTVPKAAEHIGCSVGEIRRGAKSGRFPFIVLGGRYLFSPEELDRCLHEEAEENQRKAAEKCKRI